MNTCWSVARYAARSRQAKSYQRQDPQGGVSVILGAGNVSSIPAMDVASKLFVDGFVCVLKMNPVNEWVGPFVEQALAPHGLALIRMVTPVTPPARLERLAREAQGFVYAVSMTGTTGRSVGGGTVPRETLDYLDRVRKLASVPVCAGFGIREHAQVAALAPHVDGVVVGSAVIEAMEKGASTVELLKRLRG